ncbi:MAG: hypothetical protein ACI9BH_002303 [Paracoccaceae bacterium]|jgi:hypothetical protein
MQTMQQTYRGLSLIMQLNWDRFLSLFIVVAALFVGAFLGSL